MLYIMNGNVKEGKMIEYQQWVRKNEDLMKEHTPPGWKYLGTYAYVLGFGHHHIASLWECETYKDFDNWREHNDENWLRILEEAQDFFSTDPVESVLLREIGDTRIVEPKK